MNHPIRGKVAKVLNAREIAINIGDTQGVKSGMFFDVMDPNYQDITDPDTGEILGSIEHPKVRVKIITVHDRLSLASTYRFESVNVGGTGSKSYAILDAALAVSSITTLHPVLRKKYETLEKTKEIPEPFDEKDSKVKTGDPVIQVLEDDETEQEDTNEK